jgi:hypothetical protein
VAGDAVRSEPGPNLSLQKTREIQGKIEKRPLIEVRFLLEMQYFRAFPSVLPMIDNREGKKQ